MKHRTLGIIVPVLFFVLALPGCGKDCVTWSYSDVAVSPASDCLQISAENNEVGQGCSLIEEPPTETGFTLTNGCAEAFQVAPELLCCQKTEPLNVEPGMKGSFLLINQNAKETFEGARTTITFDASLGTTPLTVSLTFEPNDE